MNVNIQEIAMLIQSGAGMGLVAILLPCCRWRVTQGQRVQCTKAMVQQWGRDQFGCVNVGIIDSGCVSQSSGGWYIIKKS